MYATLSFDFHSFPVVDWFCLFIYLWVLTFPLLDCSEFGNFVITLILSVPDEGYYPYFECTWWRLLPLFWVYLMKVITLILSVPDEGYYPYCECTWWRLFLYIIWLSNLLTLSVTWWRLFQKHVVWTKFDIYVFIFNDHYLFFIYIPQ